MGRGFVSGTLWGAVVAVVLVIGASQLVDRQDMNLSAPESAAVEVPDATEFAEVREESDPVAPDSEAPALGDELAAAAPEQPRAEGDTAPVVNADPIAAPVPEATAPETPGAPETPNAPEVASAPDASLPGRTDVGVPDQPSSDQPLVAGLEAPDPLPENEPEPVTIVEDNQQAPTPDTSTGLSVPSQDIAEAPEAPRPPEAPVIAALPDPSPEEPTAPAPAAVETEETAEPEQAPAAEDTAVASAMPGRRATGLPGLSNVTPSTDSSTDVVPAAVPVEPTGSALNDFRVGYTPEGGRPLVSLILVVDADGAIPLDTLLETPFVTSFAVHAGASNASDVAGGIRNGGAEVLMIPSLPKGATPGDVEQALQANLSVIPNAIAFLDVPEASFQTDRTAVAQIVAAAGATGHGLVTFPRGLNTAQQIAERDGVPAGLVFRDLDGGGQDKSTIRRTLDQAAFRARQEGQVILVARGRDETLSVLNEWALGDRAASVEFAPVSALIAPQG